MSVKFDVRNILPVYGRLLLKHLVYLIQMFLNLQPSCVNLFVRPGQPHFGAVSWAVDSWLQFSFILLERLKHWNWSVSFVFGI